MYLSNPVQVITENENFVLFTLLQHYGIAIRLITSSGASAGLKDAEPGKLQAAVSAIAVFYYVRLDGEQGTEIVGC
jgi:hypothetical protein